MGVQRIGSIEKNDVNKKRRGPWMALKSIFSTKADISEVTLSGDERQVLKELQDATSKKIGTLENRFSDKANISMRANKRAELTASLKADSKSEVSEKVKKSNKSRISNDKDERSL